MTFQYLIEEPKTLNFCYVSVQQEPGEAKMMKHRF